MPKAILEYNLPEDQEDFKIAQEGIKRYCAMDDIHNRIFRSGRKYGHIGEKKLTEEQVDFLEEIETIYQAILAEHDL